MSRFLVAFASGLVFGLGLIISEMINPSRVRGFLDITGSWDPTLLFVMLSAVPVTSIGYFILQQRGRPFISPRFNLPEAQGIDVKLILGASLFGVGWGLSGLCPGPAVVGLVTGKSEIMVFMVAMIVGMKSYQWIVKLD